MFSYGIISSTRVYYVLSLDIYSPKYTPKMHSWNDSITKSVTGWNEVMLAVQMHVSSSNYVIICEILTFV